MKKILFSIFFLIALFSPQAIFAQSASPFFKDSATTIVGSADPLPTGSFAPIPPAPGGSASVAYWADVMASKLELNDGGTYTRLPSSITNSENGVTIKSGRYVCTGLVIAASKLGGKPVPRNGYVRYMQPNWEAVTGGALINYTSNNRLISLVRPGDVFFQRAYGDGPGGFDTGVGHVSIVYSINIDENGDGIMVTREANAPKTSIAIRFQNWEMHGYDWRGGGFSAFLFGLHKT